MEVKERILEKAHELFVRYGIRSVSMDDIASQVGISKKTIYQYYTDKDELVNAVFSALLETNQQQCLWDRNKAENALHEVFLAFDMVQEMFANMNPSVLYDMEKYHPAAFKKFQEYKNSFLYGMIKSNIERGISEGLYRPEVDIDVLTKYRIYSMMLAFNPDFFPGNRVNLVHVELQLLELFLYGLATAKGQELIQMYKQQRQKKA